VESHYPGSFSKHSLEDLQDTIESWLGPYLTDALDYQSLKKLNLEEILYFSLSQEQRHQLDKLTPKKISVPSGSKISINYRNPKEPPILSVRLQELFGLLETPKVLNGKINLLLHLLSPGFKPVQVTQDLASFWETTYFEVKKELKRRYPKHEWPEDPLTAEPIRGVKRRK
jgi:ATP-dependent helicase HrpB